MTMKLILYLIRGQTSSVLTVNPGDMISSITVITSQWRTDIDLAHVVFFMRFAANYILRDIDMVFRIQGAILTDVVRQEIHVDHVHDSTSVMSWKSYGYICTFIQSYLLISL